MTVTAKGKAKAKAKAKVSNDASPESPPRTPPARSTAKPAEEDSAPKVEAPPKNKRRASAAGDAWKKVRAVNGEALSFARRNPPTATRALAEWTAIRSAFRAKLCDFPKRSTNEDCIPTMHTFLFTDRCKLRTEGIVLYLQSFFAGSFLEVLQAERSVLRSEG